MEGYVLFVSLQNTYRSTVLTVLRYVRPLSALHCAVPLGEIKLQFILSPTASDNFEVMTTGWTTKSVTLGLARTEGSSNDTPKWAEVYDEGETVPLKVLSIDTGAGPVEMPGGELAPVSCCR